MTAQMQGPLLEPEGEIILPAIESFVIADHFKIGAIIDGREIGYLGSSVYEYFDGVVERDIPERVTRLWKFPPSHRWVSIPAIVDALGGAERATMSVAHMFQVMKCGFSRTDRNANVAFVCSPNGLLLIFQWLVMSDGSGRWDITIPRRRLVDFGPGGYGERDRVFGG